MKKIITLCLFVFALFLGTGFMSAQSELEINKEAARQTEALRKVIKLKDNQMDLVYEVYKAYGKAHASLVNSETVTDKAVEKLKKNFMDKMESVLNEEQFENYKAYIKEQQ
ncbi:hypothetical protein [Winogradskyella sp.]|uniref:hypothetical protein n=1 Tax=Winogradskyella sp. TaxID=1883156 RepID=UPI00263917A6|nr:hypothetical protein [Winogradskyella sp.]